MSNALITPAMMARQLLLLIAQQDVLPFSGAAHFVLRDAELKNSLEILTRRYLNPAVEFLGLGLQSHIDYRMEEIEAYETYKGFDLQILSRLDASTGHREVQVRLKPSELHPETVQ